MYQAKAPTPAVEAVILILHRVSDNVDNLSRLHNWRAHIDMIWSIGNTSKREGKGLYIVDLPRSDASLCCGGCNEAISGAVHYFTVSEVRLKKRQHEVTFCWLFNSTGAHTNDAYLCMREFLKSLTDWANNWYVNLKPGSVHAYEHLVLCLTPNSSVVKKSSL